MKLKLVPILFAVLTVSSFSLKAQDKKMSQTQIKQEQDQFKDRYEAQKKATQTAFNNDMKALEVQKNLTPAQRKAQMDIIKDRYEMQKKANQTTFKTGKNKLKEEREELNNGKRKGEEKNEGEEKHKDKIKHEKKEKHEEKENHERHNKMLKPAQHEHHDNHSSKPNKH